MDAREVTYEDVEQTVAAPFATRTAYRNRTNYYRVIGGFRVRVTVANQAPVIVTVWKEPS